MKLSDIIKPIGQRIRNRRTQSGLTQEKLAELAGLHPTYIGQIERGEKNITLENIYKISIALKISLSQLFDKIGVNENNNDNIPLLCYKFIETKTKTEQEQIYKILLEIDKLK